MGGLKTCFQAKCVWNSLSFVEKNLMKSIYQISLALSLLGAVINVKGQSLLDKAGTNDSENVITIEFNKNIEFLGYALHIGEPEDEPLDSSLNHPLRQALNEQRSKFRDEESLIKIFELGSELPYSLFVEIFATIDELPIRSEYKIPERIIQDNQLSTPADLNLMKEIIDQINIFYQVSEFEQFWEFSQSWYTKALEEITRIKPNKEVIETMESFYGQRFSSYKIIPSLTLWSGPGFGFKEEGKKGTEAYFVLGPLTNDFQFDNSDRLYTLTIHEFGHSFVNHILKTSCNDLIIDTEPIFAPIAEKMRPQGYPEWWYCVNEHFVRAGEVLIPELMNNQTLSQSNLIWNTEEKEFIYLPFIVNQLRRYRMEEGISFQQSVRKTMLDLKKEFMP